jgi:hypothetical protein
VSRLLNLQQDTAKINRRSLSHNSKDCKMVSPVDVTKLETRLFINNEFVNSASGKTFDTVNPATEEVICSVQQALEADVDKAVS